MAGTIDTLPPELESTLDSDLRAQLGSLKSVIEAIQYAQRILPTVTMEEFEGMRRGARPLSRSAYLLGLLQRALIGIEEAFSNIESEVEDGPRPLDVKNFREIQLNEIAAAIKALSRHQPPGV